MTKLKFKVGDVLVPTENRVPNQKITVLDTDPHDIMNAYLTSDEPNYWWHKDTVEMCYELSEEKQPPKFKVGDKLKADNPDWNKASLNVEVLEVNPNSESDMYRTSDDPLYFWSRRVVEENYYLADKPKEETVEPEHKFKVGDILGRLNNDRFCRLIREIDNEGNYWVSRYNVDMLTPEDETFKLSATYVHNSYQLIKKPTEFEVLLENARRDRKRVNKAKLEYLKYQEKYERAMESYDKAQLAVTKYVQSKINEGLED